MIFPRAVIALTIASAAVSGSAGAQYRRASTDTVRLREVTTGTTTLTTPGGPMQLRTEHDAVVSILFRDADSASAWYEALRIAVASPQGRTEPGTAAALGKPFELSIDSRGRVRTLSSPAFPASFEGVTDLSHQFDDFLPRLPATPLAAGLAWEDTSTVQSRGPDGAGFRAETHIRASVVHDTVINGEPGWLVRAEQSTAMSIVQRVKGQSLTARTTLTGADSGYFVFSRSEGRVLMRHRVGTLTGTITYEGGPQPTVIPIEQRYSNSLTRVR